MQDSEQNWKRLAIILPPIAAIVAAIITAVVPNLFNKSMTSQSQPAQASTKRKLLPQSGQLVQYFNFLFKDFYNDGGLIVISNPPVYKYLNEDEIQYVNDCRKKNINHFNKDDFRDFEVVPLLSPDYVGKRKQNKFEFLIKSNQQYTGIGEALGLECISRHFSIVSNRSKLQIKQSRFLTEDIKDNIILLGGWVANIPAEEIFNSDKFKKYLKRIPFRSHDGKIWEYYPDPNIEKPYKNTGFNYNINKAEGKVYIEIEYAIISKIKHFLHNGTIIICAGINSSGTEAACKIISHIDPNTIVQSKVNKIKNELIARYDDVPEWFQVIIKVPVNNGVPGKYDIIDARKLNFSGL